MSRYHTDSLFAEEELAEQSLCNHIIRVAFESAALTVREYIYENKSGQRIAAENSIFLHENPDRLGFVPAAITFYGG